MDDDNIVSVSNGKVMYGYDLNAGLTKPYLALGIYNLLNRNNLRVLSKGQIGIALMNSTMTGTTGTTGTTTIVTGDTGTGFGTGSTQVFENFNSYTINCAAGSVIISGGTTTYYGQYGVAYNTDPWAVVGSATTVTCSGGSLVVFGIASVPGNALWVSGGTVWLSGCTTGDTMFYNDCSYESFPPFTSGTTTGTTGTTVENTGSTGSSCYTTLDMLDLLSCYGSPTSGATSGCTMWDFNNNGNVDSGDLLSLLANFCTSGTSS